MFIRKDLLAAGPGNQKSPQEMVQAEGGNPPREAADLCMDQSSHRKSEEAGLQLFDDMLRKSCLVGSRKSVNDEIIKHSGVK